MKKIFAIIASAAMVAGLVSCEKDHSYEDNTPKPINNYDLRGANDGKWELTGIDGKELPAGLYQYIVFNTADMEFEIIQNLNSQNSVSLTGMYSLEYNETDGNVLSGDYDHASGPWANDYVISSLTSEKMVWAVLGDPASTYTYVTCPEIPGDRMPGIKSM